MFALAKAAWNELKLPGCFVDNCFALCSVALQPEAAAAETMLSSRQIEHAGEWHFQAEHKTAVCLLKCALRGTVLNISAGPIIL
jgi:hypothetical protein